MKRKSKKFKVNIELNINPAVMGKLSRLYDLLLVDCCQDAFLDVGPIDYIENKLCTPSEGGCNIAIKAQ